MSKCDECGEVEFSITCRFCKKVVVWCPNCQKEDFRGQAEYELCDPCLEKEAVASHNCRIEYAGNVEIRVQVVEWSDDEMTKAAIENATDQRAAFIFRATERGDQINCGHQEYQPNKSRAVVSMLRHRFTNYDEILEHLPPIIKSDFSSDCFDDVDDEPHLIIRRRVHQALSKVYPNIDCSLDDDC